MIALRRIAGAALALLALAAAIAAVIWAGALAGLAQPVVVVTGSMQPAFQSGDLLIATRVPVGDLAPGDTVAVPSAGSGPLVPERVVSADAQGPGAWTLTTATDASGRTTEHRVGTEAWAPTLRVPLLGGAAASVVEPRVGLPLLAVVGLLVAALLVGRAPARRGGAPLTMRSSGARP